MTEVTAGTVLGGNIRLERQLGAGGMGTVWLAHNQSLGGDVAVKVLRSGIGNAEARARFEREARAAAQLTSPHVVRVYDYGVTQHDQPYIVMEYLRGRCLLTLLERDGPLTPALTAELIRQVCRGLSEAHAQQLIHRDIKPANIFVIDNNGEPFVKLLDFGVAKSTNPGELDITDTGAMIGTPYYMSPEQLIAPREVDARSDLWSLGVVAYVCLTGELPFRGETLGALSVAIHAGDYAPMTTHRPSLPDTLNIWMKSALAQAPQRRFQTAQGLTAALDIAVANTAVAAQAIATATIPNIDATIGLNTTASAGVTPDDESRQPPPRPAISDVGANTDTSWITRQRHSSIRSRVGIGVGMVAVGLFGWWLGRTPSERPATTAQASNTASMPTPSNEPTHPATSTAASPRVAPSVAVADENGQPPAAPSATTTATATARSVTPRQRTTHPATVAAPHPSATAAPTPSASASSPSWDQPFYPAASPKDAEP